MNAINNVNVYKIASCLKFDKKTSVIKSVYKKTDTISRSSIYIIRVTLPRSILNEFLTNVLYIKHLLIVI